MTHYLYLITTSNNETKIGISNDVERRFKALQSANPQKLILSTTIAYETEEQSRNVERALHKHFADKNIHYEWFDVSVDEILSIIDLASTIANLALNINVEQKISSGSTVLTQKMVL